MGKRRTSPSPSSPSPSPSPSDRCQWERIFKTLVEMLQSQQSQIETLADERKYLESYIQLQHDYWSSKARFLESHIAQFKKEEAKGRKIQAAKLDLMVETKKREALCYKKQYELAESDLEDICACVETLNAELSGLKEKLKTREGVKSRTGMCDFIVENCKGNERSAALEREMRKLKHSYKQLSSKETEVSALLEEKDFVWNQLKKIESDYTAAIKNKRIEVANANEAIGKLQHNVEELQTSVNEKEETIAKLRSELAKLEKDMHNSTIGKSKISKEHLENASKTPSETNPRKGSKKHKSESAHQGTTQRHQHVYDDSLGSRASAPVHGLVRCSSKPITRSDSSIKRPALFHSNFKGLVRCSNKPLTRSDSSIERPALYHSNFKVIYFTEKLDVEGKSEKPRADRRRHYAGKRRLNDEQRHTIENFLLTPMTSYQFVSDRQGIYATRKMLQEILFWKKIKDDAIDSYALLLMMKAIRYPDQLHRCIYITPTFWNLYTLGRMQSALKIVDRIRDEDFEKASMIITPICSHDHWYLVLCNLVDGQFDLISSITSRQYDITSKEFVDWMKEFLSSKPLKSNPKHWLLNFDRECPQQRNKVDCGIFVMAYMHSIWHRKSFDFTQNDIAYYRGLFAYHLLKGEIEGYVKEKDASI